MLDWERHTGFKRAMVGRKKQFEKRITLPLSQVMLDKVDLLLEEGEARLDFIRAAIAHEIENRKTAAGSR